MRNHKKNVKVMFRNFETSFQERQASRRAWRNTNYVCNLLVFGTRSLNAKVACWRRLSTLILVPLRPARVPDAWQSPKTQNNLMNASRRTQRSIDGSIWKCLCRKSCSCNFLFVAIYVVVIYFSPLIFVVRTIYQFQWTVIKRFGVCLQIL